MTCWDKPQLAPIKNVVDISLKYNHILALTSSGEVYAWGDNEFGQCGLGSNEKIIRKPTRVRGLEAYHIRQISAGLNYSLIRCEPKHKNK